MRTVLGIGAYFAATALADITLGASDAWFLATAVINVAAALVSRRPRVLLLPLVFMAALAVFDKLFYRSNGTGDCHDWCGEMVLWGGYLIYWLPLALFASGTTLFILMLVTVRADEIGDTPEHWPR